MERNNDFLPLQGKYEDLVVYKIARCLYAITYYFANTYLDKGDRTIDQMVQAARSGKQNIAEGSVDGSTSKEMEIKLMNVARGSMHELKADYEDYLMNRGLARWDKDDDRTKQTRLYCRKHNEPEDYMDAIKQRSDETIANIALTLLHQYDQMMVKLIERIKERFLAEGGIKEEMFRARKERRGY
ncbi:MAG: four helix bundle suffix domain-containing protein [Prevotella sp.]|nr:four helix bundle suffix domain-containing protein [Prevotella sp.]